MKHSVSALSTISRVHTVRTVQAAAMVGMCLAAGYIIAFGAGLVWPRPPDGEGATVGPRFGVP